MYLPFRNRYPVCCAFAVLLCVGIVQFAVAQISAPASLHIQLNMPLHRVSPTLYGLMTEEINYSYDGGLYAEMVRNRTFNGRAGKQAAHWYMLEQGDAIGTMEIDDRNGPSDALQSSLMLSITQADAHSQAGVGNDGYWGMAVHPNTTYHGSFYAKSATSDLGPVTISLINDTSGAVQATIQSSPIATDWKRYEFTLATGAQIAPSANNHLLLTVAHPGKLWLSLVSLFPPTFKDRSNGNRPDMMQLLQAMKPSFLRFQEAITSKATRSRIALTGRPR